jgi:molecular chaperone DnaJ
MNIKEAFSVLGLEQTSSPDEIKKSFKTLAKKYHPDVNKNPEAEKEFKRVNEAYQVITNGQSSDPEDRIPSHNARNPFNPFADFFQEQGVFHPADNIETSITISFKESVLGCKKDLTFSRKIKCQNCNGQGQTQIHNGCDKCGGKGRIISKQGHMIFNQACPKCHGRSQTTPCPSCQSKGTIDSEASVNVSIPGGIQDGNILRLGGMGHYVGSSFMFADQHTDVHLRITVIPESSLKLEGMDVISTLEISLLDALRGCEKKIKTIEGAKDIQIPPLSRHKEEVILPKLGVNHLGRHRIILDVKYPNKTDDLIQTLTQGK